MHTVMARISKALSSFRFNSNRLVWLREKAAAFSYLAAVCGVVLAIISASSGEREPKYKGQTLTYWLKKLRRPSEDESSTAIRQSAQMRSHGLQSGLSMNLQRPNSVCSTLPKAA